MNFKKYCISDVGNIRSRNEDSYLDIDLNSNGEKGVVMVVADGMGGHRAGDVASRVVIETIKKRILSKNHDPDQESLKDAVIEANNKVFGMSRENSDYSGMGSTCTAILIIRGMAYVAHVGDSRAYLVRNGESFKITSDHTVAEQMRMSGSITSEKARHSPQRHILTNAIGIRQDIDIDVIDSIDTIPDDSYILCSDGLTEYIEDSELANIITQHDPEDACKLLVDIAKQRGGSDNITALIVKVFDNGSGSKRRILRNFFKRK